MKLAVLTLALFLLGITPGLMKFPGLLPETPGPAKEAKWQKTPMALLLTRLGVERL